MKVLNESTNIHSSFFLLFFLLLVAKFIFLGLLSVITGTLVFVFVFIVVCERRVTKATMRCVIINELPTLRHSTRAKICAAVSFKPF